MLRNGRAMNGKIAVILGSKDDLPVVEEGIVILDDLEVAYDLHIMSAHRNPDTLREYCVSMEEKGIRAVIACAGRAAALPGFVASYSDVPVIGVALKGGLLDGLDALFSIVSVPKGLGLVCSGVGESAFFNAVIHALQILSLGSPEYRLKLKTAKERVT
ncbi:MAG: 5-(carboxyamino)imidazole ribonucleotide mutase [Candidatus Omnitrophica bacterium]|nr:5-(carboxyamino)imidazole ribonucleotide mutase [Candidatus Omnitrophota bacterium]